jgi:hypothetical protein
MARLGRLRWLVCVSWLAAACSDPVPDAPFAAPTSIRPAPRVLGDSFCIEPPEVQGDLRPVWALALDGPSPAVTTIATDPQGRLLVGGLLFESLRVGDLQLTSIKDGSMHPFVLVIEADGAVRWGKAFPGVWFPVAVRGDDSGGVEVAGAGEPPPIDFGTQSVDDPFAVGRFDADGNLVAVQGMGAAFANLSVIPAIGPAGEVAMLDAASFELTVFGRDASRIWSVNAPSLAQGQLVFDPSGDLIGVATFYGTLDWVTPPITVPSSGGIMARFNRAGELVWLRRLGTEVFTSGLSHSGGRVVVPLLDPMFIGATVTSFAESGAAEPTVAWSREFEVDPYVGSLVFTSALPDGGAYVWGAAAALTDLGRGPISEGGAFLAHIDATGATEAAIVFHSVIPAVPFHLTASANGDAFIIGGYSESIDLGVALQRATSPEGTGMFVAKVTAAPSPLAPKRCVSAPRPGTVLGDPSPITPEKLALSGTTVALTTGDEVVKVAATGGEPEFVATKQPQPVAIVADARAVYWATAGPELPGADRARDGAILSVPIAGGPIRMVVGQLAGVETIAIDDRTLYFAVGPVARGNTVTLGKLMAMPLEGGTPTELASGYTEIGPLVAIGGGAIVVGRTATTGSQNLQRVRMDGRSDTLAISDFTVPALAVDDETLFWLETAGSIDESVRGVVRAVSLRGGPIRNLTGVLDTPAGLVLAGDNVYVAAMDKQGVDLLRIPKAGGTPGKLARGFVSIGPLASDGSRLAWVQRTDDFTWSLVVRRP